MTKKSDAGPSKRHFFSLYSWPWCSFSCRKPFEGNRSCLYRLKHREFLNGQQEIQTSWHDPWAAPVLADSSCQWALPWWKPPREVFSTFSVDFWRRLVHGEPPATPSPLHQVDCSWKSAFGGTTSQPLAVLWWQIYINCIGGEGFKAAETTSNWHNNRDNCFTSHVGSCSHVVWVITVNMGTGSKILQSLAWIVLCNYSTTNSEAFQSWHTLHDTEKARHISW